jgi:hypothetical protein
LCPKVPAKRPAVRHAQYMYAGTHNPERFIKQPD